MSTLAVIYLGSVTEKARDAQRVDDISKLATAMELYKQETGSYLPGHNNCRADESGFKVELAPFVTQGLIGEIPCEPLEERLGTGRSYFYFNRTPVTWWANTYCGNEDAEDFEYFFLFTPETTNYTLMPFSNIAATTESSCGPDTDHITCCIPGPKK